MSIAEAAKLVNDAEGEGLTPNKFVSVFKDVLEKYSAATALTYSVVFRTCQYGDGTCDLSLNEIAKKVGVSRRSIIRSIQALRNDGLIVDTTPEEKTSPHVYRDGGVVNHEREIVIWIGGVS